MKGPKFVVTGVGNDVVTADGNEHAGNVRCGPRSPISDASEPDRTGRFSTPLADNTGATALFVRTAPIDGILMRLGCTIEAREFWTLCSDFTTCGAACSDFTTCGFDAGAATLLAALTPLCTAGEFVIHVPGLLAFGVPHSDRATSSSNSKSFCAAVSLRKFSGKPYLASTLKLSKEGH